MSAYDEKDAAQDTGVPQKEVERAWHAARDDDDSLTERVVNKVIEGGVNTVRTLFGLDGENDS